MNQQTFVMNFKDQYKFYLMVILYFIIILYELFFMLSSMDLNQSIISYLDLLKLLNEFQLKIQNLIFYQINLFLFSIFLLFLLIIVQYLIVKILIHHYYHSLFFYFFSLHQVFLCRIFLKLFPFHAFIFFQLFSIYL